MTSHRFKLFGSGMQRRKASINARYIRPHYYDSIHAVDAGAMLAVARASRSPRAKPLYRYHVPLHHIDTAYPSSYH